MNHKDESSTYGFESVDWKCPVCGATPQAPSVACHECGCHLLLLVKIRRLSDDYRLKQNTNAANALYRPSTP